MFVCMNVCLYVRAYLCMHIHTYVCMLSSILVINGDNYDTCQNLA